MAIALDATSTNSGTGTSITLAHTCTGSNLILWYGILIDGDKVTSVTYNSVAMTQMTKTTVDGLGRYIYLYYLIAPSTGTNNIVATLSSSSAFINNGAISYTGAKQSGVPDAQVTNTELAAQTSITTTVTTVADQCWLVGFYRNDTGAWTAGANTTIRVNMFGSGAATVLVDSNAARSTGSNSLTATCASATVAGIMASFSPAAAEVSTGEEYIMITS